MPAGESARRIAARSAAAAALHTKKAATTAQFGARFAAGAAGEEALHAALIRLANLEWRPIPDRRSPWGGNFDELFVGPAGVAVIDSKAWSNPATVHGDHLYAGGRRYSRAIDGVLRQVDAVRAALEPTHAAVATRGFIALTGCDRARQPEEVRGVWVTGLDHLEAGFSRLPSVLDASSIAAVCSVLEASFPDAAGASGAPVPPAPSEPPAAVNPIVDRRPRIFYVHPWSYRRLYLKDADGVEMGWKDERTGVHVTCTGDGALLARALLEGASFTGLRTSSEDLPRVPLEASGGTRDAGHAGSAWTAVLVGMESRGRGRHRLYGTYLLPEVGTFSLGFVDLRSGVTFPSVHGPLAPGLAPPVQYLRLLWERWPGPPSATGDQPA